MIALAMLALTFVANLVVIQYAIGASRAAVDRGARAGSALGASLEACQSEATHTLRGEGGLLRGAFGDSVLLTCRREGATVVARAEGRFRWWLGPLPEVGLVVESHSVIETPP